MQNLAKYLPLPINNVDLYHQSYWRVCNHELMEEDIRVTTKDGLLRSIQDKMEDKYH